MRTLIALLLATTALAQTPRPGVNYDDAKIGNHVAEIKALVVNSVQGLPYDGVTVTLFSADPTLTTGIRIASMPYDWSDDAAWLAGGLFIGIGTIAAARGGRWQVLRSRLGKLKRSDKQQEPNQ